MLWQWVRYGVVLWMAGCFAISGVCNATQPIEEQSPQRFINELLDLAVACVDGSDAIHDKEDVFKLLADLRQHGVYLETAASEPRVKFVQIQGVMEHLMAHLQASGEICKLAGVIHTPTPSTPLCTLPNEDPSEGLLDPSIAFDMDKVLTVRSRAQIVREFLHKGGDLYIAYPQGGLERRTEEQREIYLQALEQFPNHLFDCMLSTHTLPGDKIGATYLMCDCFGHVYLFAIKNTQANDPSDGVEWGLWFGEATAPGISQRMRDIFEYLNSVQGPDLRSEFGLL